MRLFQWRNKQWESKIHIIRKFPTRTRKELFVFYCGRRFPPERRNYQSAHAWDEKSTALDDQSLHLCQACRNKIKEEG